MIFFAFKGLTLFKIILEGRTNEKLVRVNLNLNHVSFENLKSQRPGRWRFSIRIYLTSPPRMP